MANVQYKCATIYINKYSDGEYDAYVAQEYISSKPRAKGRSEKKVVDECKVHIDEYLRKANKTSFSMPETRTQKLEAIVLAS